MKHSSNNLKQELMDTGASRIDAEQLADLAAMIKNLKKDHVAAQTLHNKLVTYFQASLIPITVLAVISLLIVLSQNVLPGGWLFPIQRVSDNVAMSLDPNYRGTVMMKRAVEVKKLVEIHAPYDLVLATLSDYQTNAVIYSKVSSNYADFNYCKSKLQQASVLAPASERSAINNTLIMLEKT